MPRILVCLDTDAQPSVFDGIVAIDAGVDHLFRHGNVGPDDVRDLVYGAMFTRGPTDLKNTAIFIGGSNVVDGERLLAEATECFFGPMRVSVMLDSNGANTTAAAAVIAAGRHLDLSSADATVLAATGPVGLRVTQLLAGEGAQIRVASRQLERAQKVCERVRSSLSGARLEPHATSDHDSLNQAVDGAQIVIAAGAPGVELMTDSTRRRCASLKVAIDLSAVPPAGIGGIEPQDKAAERDGHVCYGAIGVGGTKMSIHKAAIRRLFESNDKILDAEQIYALGKSL